MAVEELSVTQAVTQAREVIANFPRTGAGALHLEAVNEVIGLVTGLDIRIPQPPSVGYMMLGAALGRDIPHLALVYLPEQDSGNRFPSIIHQRLSTEGWQSLHSRSLGVEGGWRVMDLREIIEGCSYIEDTNFLGPIIAALRASGNLPKPEDLGIQGIPHDSRTCLLPVEIEDIVSPRADELLRLPRGIMRLPTVREAMMASALYKPALIAYSEWQSAELDIQIHPRAPILHPAGLVNTHDSSDGQDSYYGILVVSKHKHRPNVGFRLMGKLT